MSSSGKESTPSVRALDVYLAGSGKILMSQVRGEVTQEHGWLLWQDESGAKQRLMQSDCMTVHIGEDPTGSLGSESPAPSEPQPARDFRYLYVHLAGEGRIVNSTIRGEMNVHDSWMYWQDRECFEHQLLLTDNTVVHTSDRARL